jgi:hypothetical protein
MAFTIFNSPPYHGPAGEPLNLYDLSKASKQFKAVITASKQMSDKMGRPRTSETPLYFTIPTHHACPKLCETVILN